MIQSRLALVAEVLGVGTLRALLLAVARDRDESSALFRTLGIAKSISRCGYGSPPKALCLGLDRSACSLPRDTLRNRCMPPMPGDISILR
jgi:hypothetical protein